MPHKPVNFKLTEVKRALRALREEGVPIEGVQFASDSGFTIRTGKLEIANVDDAAKQQWQRATEELQANPKTKPTKKAKGKKVRS